MPVSPTFSGQKGIVEGNVLEKYRAEHGSAARWVDFGIELAMGVVFKKKKKKRKRLEKNVIVHFVRYLSLYPSSQK